MPCFNLSSSLFLSLFRTEMHFHVELKQTSIWKIFITSISILFFASLLLLCLFFQPDCQSRNNLIIHHKDPLALRVLSFCGSSSAAQRALIVPAEPYRKAFQTGPDTTDTYPDEAKNEIKSLCLSSFFLLSEPGQNYCSLLRLLKDWWFNFGFYPKYCWGEKCFLLILVTFSYTLCSFYHIESEDGLGWKDLKDDLIPTPLPCTGHLPPKQVTQNYLLWEEKSQWQGNSCFNVVCYILCSERDLWITQVIMSHSNICTLRRNQIWKKEVKNRKKEVHKNMWTWEKACVISLTQTTSRSAKRIDKQRSVSKSLFLLINLLIFSSH